MTFKLFRVQRDAKERKLHKVKGIINWMMPTAKSKSQKLSELLLQR